MIQKIDNLKEKELVIAYYFCGNTHKQFSKYEVFDMWSNWFKKDFRIRIRRFSFIRWIVAIQSGVSIGRL